MMTMPLSHLERRKYPGYPRNRAVVMNAIITAAAEAFGVTPAEALSQKRRIDIIAARHVAMFLCREFGFSLSEIAGHFKRRDHTTVLYACQRIDAKVRADEMFHGAVSLIAGRAGLA